MVDEAGAAGPPGDIDRLVMVYDAGGGLVGDQADPTGAGWVS